MNNSGDEKKLRNDLELAWRSFLGDYMIDGQSGKAIELANSTDDIMKFVQKFLQSNGCALSSNNDAKNLVEPSTSTKAPNIEKHHVLFVEIKKLLAFATLSTGPDCQANDDRLFMIFGQSWKFDPNMNVLRAVITSNSRSSREAVCKVKFPSLNAICVLPNPDWLIGQKIWDAFDDYQLMINHLRAELPNAIIILATFPIESNTGVDPAFFQFNMEITRRFDLPGRKFRIAKTADMIPKQFDYTLIGDKRELLFNKSLMTAHYLSETMGYVVMRELSNNLINAE